LASIEDACVLESELPAALVDVTDDALLLEECGSNFPIQHSASAGGQLCAQSAMK